ncbi:GNAT family N-acetyltransferase [Streptomyces sp. NPDC057638]|uniref:GNAT family N-acetyltransferase n=1 Tax=Streptomyces sp. NPDC057638 TaxID=3346190 RepID=UPI0036B04405
MVPPSFSHALSPFIRPATAGELAQLQEIERAAGEPFRSLGMTEIADDEPPALNDLERYRAAGGAWVYTGANGANGESGALLAYLLDEEVDGAAHIEQVSVRPSAARRGIGRELIEHLADRARTRGLSGMTLTTFAEVPWNAPYYARLGFRELPEPELTEGLRRIRRHEREIGLDRWPRLCMRRSL